MGESGGFVQRQIKMITQTWIWDELRVSNEKNKSIKLLNESTRNYP